MPAHLWACRPTRRSSVSCAKTVLSELSVAHDTETEVIFRSWSVGIGAVGALHTSREAYEEVLGDLHDDRLIVRTFFRSYPIPRANITGVVSPAELRKYSVRNATSSSSGLSPVSSRRYALSTTFSQSSSLLRKIS